MTGPHKIRLMMKAERAAAMGACKWVPVMDIRLPEKSAFILGHEERGLQFEPELFDRLQRLTIPQYGRSDSLNVSVAASIVLYEYVRQIRVRSEN
ncbi:MAG: TrmH family RNA methyltransferase [Desulfotignum sp.]|nr:TrmH family RNA methyltransferase [Desulfotignum sp.]